MIHRLALVLETRLGRVDDAVASLSDAEAERVRTVAIRAVDAVCTVGRTLKAGTEVVFDIDGSGP